MTAVAANFLYFLSLPYFLWLNASENDVIALHLFIKEWVQFVSKRVVEGNFKFYLLDKALNRFSRTMAPVFGVLYIIFTLKTVLI